MRLSVPDRISALPAVPRQPVRRPHPTWVLLCAPVHMIGGHALAARQIAAGFNGDDDVRASIQAIDPRLPGPLRWLTTVKLIRSVFRPVVFALGVARTARQVDVIHVFAAAHTAFLFAVLPALLVGRLFRKPVIINYRDGRAEAHLRHSPRVVRWALAQASALVVPSAFLQAVFARHGFKALVIANSVDTSAFRFRDPLPLKPRLISARVLEPLYGIENILQAFAIVRAHVPNAECDVYGSGESEPSLRRLAEELGAGGITFRGRLSHDEMAKMLAESGILVNSSRIDNQPHTLIEAFASGVPVVTTAAGGIPDIVEHGRTGLLVPIDQPAALAEAVLRLLREPELVRSLTAAARAECERYTWSAAKQQWSELYARLADRRRTGLEE